MLGVLDGDVIVGNKEPLAVSSKGQLDSWSCVHLLIPTWAVAVEVAERMSSCVSASVGVRGF